MKKSLIALAVLGASSFAMAQSSVTLYGVADAGIGKIKTGAPAGNDASNSTQFLSGSLMNNGNSRLGVRGVEDLGGGLKAGFNFETGLDLDQGDALGSGGGFWGRAANLWLGGNWGTFKLGRSLNPTFYGIAAWELTGVANYSVVGNTYNVAGGGPRNNSQFSYKTPDMGGLSAEVGYVLKADNAGRAKWDLNVRYANGPIGLGFAANKTKDIKTNYVLGGKYNFSNFVLAASYTNAYNAANAQRRGFSLGGTANFGAMALTLDLTRDTKNDWTGKKYTNGLVEAKYALSKRTFVYGAYLRLDGNNNYGIGVRHNF
jgi:predicted porin